MAKKKCPKCRRMNNSYGYMYTGENAGDYTIAEFNCKCGKKYSHRFDGDAQTNGRLYNTIEK